MRQKKFSKGLSVIVLSAAPCRYDTTSKTYKDDLNAIEMLCIKIPQEVRVMCVCAAR